MSCCNVNALSAASTNATSAVKKKEETKTDFASTLLQALKGAQKENDRYSLLSKAVKK